MLPLTQRTVTKVCKWTYIDLPRDIHLLYPTEITYQHNVPCPPETGVQLVLSSWVACTSCGVWGDNLQQEHAPRASVAHRQEPTAWSPASQASGVTHKELEVTEKEGGGYLLMWAFLRLTVDWNSKQVIEK